MKWKTFSMLLSCLFAFCLSAIHAEAAEEPESILDMIPAESLACIAISDLDAVTDLVVESPEWKEIMGLQEIAEKLDQAKQVLSFGPMLFGISIDEFQSTFGHSMAVCLLGFEGQMPVAGLVVYTGKYKEQVEYAVDQASTLPAVAGGAKVEESKYRDVPCTVAGNDKLQIKHGFIDNFLIAGLGGGFEKLVDFHKDGGKSIRDTENFKLIKQKASLSGNICVYADLERAAPIIKQIAGTGAAEAGEGDPAAKMPAMLANLALDSAKAFALNLDLLGRTNEVYLCLKQKEPHPITDVVLAPRSPMYSADLLPLADGVMAGVHIGDPAELLDRGLKLAEFLGVATQKIEDQIKQIEDAAGLSLRDDLLSTLTGEIAVMAMLPKEHVELQANPLQLAMQASKVRPVILIGVKDREKLGKTFEKLSRLANAEGLPLKEESHKGAKIYTKAVPLNLLIPGVALVPAYSFRDNLLIMSNSSEWVRDAIDLMESPGDPEIRKKLSESRILVYIDAAGIAKFAMEQNIIEDIKPPEPVREKLISLGSVAASFALGPDGAGIRLISTSDDVWAIKILRGAAIAIHLNIAKAAEREEALKRAAWEEEHEMEPTEEGTEEGAMEDER